MKIELPTEDDPVKVVCGDCLDVLRELPDGCVDAVVTDPPYGVDHKPGGRMSKVRGGIEGDHEPPDIRWIARYPSVIWGGNNFCDQLPRSTGWLIWDKTHAETCEHSQAELAWTNVVRTIRWHRQAYHGFMRQRAGWFHQHQKPVELMRWCIRFLPEHCDLILDPFGGSGTTAVAALHEGRRCLIIEKDAGYCDITRRRVAEAMGVGKGSFLAPSAGLFDEEGQLT